MISGARKAPDRMLGARSRPGAWRAARGSELSARRQPTCHGLATVNVIEITAFAKACRVSAFPPCGRLMLPVPIFGVGLPYGWASWPTWPRIDVRGRLFGGLRPLPILGYRGAVRPPMCVLVVGTVCNLGPACPGFFFISATRETEPPQRPRLSQRGAMWPRVGGCARHLTG